MENPKLRCIIIEDELKARKLLSHLIQKVAPEVEILASNEDLNSGIAAIQKHQPNIVFLDIHLPNNLGLELFDKIENINFNVIFTTAYDEYAVKAFELSATDYLLKPIHPDRLKQAIEKVKKKSPISKTITPSPKQPIPNLNQIALLRNNIYQYRLIEEIICVEADRSYCNVILNKERFTLSKSLNKIEQLLNHHSDLLRVHRSWLINLNFIASISYTNNQIVLTNKMVIPIGKSYKAKLKECLQ